MPAHGSRERRWRVAVLAVVVVAGVAIAVGVRGTPVPAAAVPTAAALVSAPDAESSAWYCTGQSMTGGTSAGFLILTNTTANTVTADITATSDSGATAQTSVAVLAHSVATPALAALASGSWLSETVITSGGGLAVTQAVSNSLGWSQSPCLTTTSAQWYFAGGSTAAANTLSIALLNPTSTPVVVDLTFVTPAGMVHPINYQGIVLQPGQMVVENVASEVQQINTVSTIVSARTGRVVASEVQGLVGAGASSGGLALVPGVASPQSDWAIPQAQEVSGGNTEIDVFNPGQSTEAVTVRFRLPSGPLAPLTEKVLPGTTWVIPTSTETRLPASETYTTTIDATGGPGVVVNRTVNIPGSSVSPQDGMAVAVDGLSSRSPSGSWVVPPPGTIGQAAVSGVAPAYLALLNTSSSPESYRAFASTASGDHVLATGMLAAGSVEVVTGTTLAAAGLDTILVHASGPMAVSEDLTPSAGLGVVSMPGIPLAAAIDA
jgi:hypothetical protein